MPRGDGYRWIQVHQPAGVRGFRSARHQAGRWRWCRTDAGHAMLFW